MFENPTTFFVLCATVVGRLRIRLKYSKNRGVFCHVTHDKTAFSEVVSSVWRPCLFSAFFLLCFLSFFLFINS